MIPAPLARLWQAWRRAARQLTLELTALYLAARDPRVPWPVRAWVMLVVAYAVSPIDLIPDFIPVLGYLDDLILVPLGLFIALKAIPPEVLRESRAAARLQADSGRLVIRWAVWVVIGLWLVGALVVVGLVVRAWQTR